MAKDVAWNCPYKCGATKPTAKTLCNHMGDHHRTAMRATIDAGLARADKKLDARNRKRAAAAKKKKSGPKPKPAQAKTARALEEHAAAFNTASTAVKQK